MTSRRVQVDLVLNARNYLDESKAVRAETAATERTLHGLGDELDSTSHHLDDWAANTDAAKHQIGDFGDKSRGAARDLTVLDERIKATRRSVMALGFEFAATGDAAAGKRFGDQQSLLAKLEKLKAALSNQTDGTPLVDVLSGVGKARSALSGGGSSHGLDLGNIGSAGLKEGEQVGNNVLSGIGSAFSGLGPEVQVILISSLAGVVVAALPAIGAMVAGAVTGVVGLGGIAGGIFAASKDPVVRSAATEFGGDLSRMFFGSGASFVDPIRQALAILDNDLGKLDLKSAFAAAAPLVTTLAAGIGGMAVNFMPGFTQALRNAGPYVAALAIGLANIGRALGDFTLMASRSHGSLEGLQVLLGFVTANIRVLGSVLEWLSNRFHQLNVFVHGLLGVLDKTLDMMGEHSDKVHNLVLQLDDLTTKQPQLITSTAMLGDAWAGSAYRADAFADAVKAADLAQTDYITHTLAARDATLGVAQGWIDLQNGLVKGKKNWDDNTQAGIDNQQMLVRQIDALQRQRQAAIDAGDGTAASVLAADRAYNDQIAVLEALAVKAGDTKAAFEAMAKTYSIRVDIDVHSAGVKAAAVDKNLALHGFASGGDPTPGGWSWVGESGPELVKFGSPAHVFTNAESASMTHQWSAAGAVQQWGRGPASAAALPNLALTVQLTDSATGRVMRSALIDDALNRGRPNDVVAGAYP